MILQPLIDFLLAQSPPGVSGAVEEARPNYLLRVNQEPDYQVRGTRRDALLTKEDVDPFQLRHRSQNANSPPVHHEINASLPGPNGRQPSPMSREFAEKQKLKLPRVRLGGQFVVEVGAGAAQALPVIWNERQDGDVASIRQDLMFMLAQSPRTKQMLDALGTKVTLHAGYPAQNSDASVLGITEGDPDALSIILYIFRPSSAAEEVRPLFPWAYSSRFQLAEVAAHELCHAYTTFSTGFSVRAGMFDDPKLAYHLLLQREFEAFRHQRVFMNELIAVYPALAAPRPAGLELMAEKGAEVFDNDFGLRQAVLKAYAKQYAHVRDHTGPVQRTTLENEAYQRWLTREPLSGEPASFSAVMLTRLQHEWVLAGA